MPALLFSAPRSMSCETTVLTGSSGAFWYKPANTEACLTAAAFPTTGANITGPAFLGFRVNDPVTLAYPVGATVTGAIAAGDYFIKTYDAATGVMTLSSTAGGTAVTATAAPTGFGDSLATIVYRSFAPVAQTRDWSFEVTLSEIDVTTIGVPAGQFAPFRRYQTSYADGTGTATIYFTEDDSALANRLITDVMQRKQKGAAVKLYIDTVSSGGTVSDILSRYIEAPVVLTSANFAANPDDALAITVNFRPSGNVTLDFLQSA